MSQCTTITTSILDRAALCTAWGTDVEVALRDSILITCGCMRYSYANEAYAAIATVIRRDQSQPNSRHYNGWWLDSSHDGDVVADWYAHHSEDRNYLASVLREAVDYIDCPCEGYCG